jgi:hypothetical protein
MKEVELTGGELSDYPNNYYRKFFDKFKEINTLEVKEWRPVHLISLFCKLYEENYHVKYQFKFSSKTPSKSFEVFQIKKLATMLTSDPVLLKQYIEWVFRNKIRYAKRRITSISFLTREEIMNEYKINFLLSNKNIDRTTDVPEDIIATFDRYGYPISNYGDLAFLYKIDPKPDKLNYAFVSINFNGFDLSVLDKII